MEWVIAAVVVYLTIGFGLSLKEWLAERRIHRAAGASGWEPRVLGPFAFFAVLWPFIAAGTVLIALDDAPARRRAGT